MSQDLRENIGRKVRYVVLPDNLDIQGLGL